MNKVYFQNVYPRLQRFLFIFSFRVYFSGYLLRDLSSRSFLVNLVTEKVSKGLTASQRPIVKAIFDGFQDGFISVCFVLDFLICHDKRNC